MMNPLKMIKTLLLSLLMLVVYTASANTLDADKYQAFYGDLNGDGHKDIYLAPKPKIILIASDITIPIPLAGDGDGYKLLAQFSGYDNPVLDNTVDTRNLKAGVFSLHSVDLNSDNTSDLFVQSNHQSLLSFTLANSWDTAPYILQTFASVGSDTHTLNIIDSNNDNRSDIVLTSRSNQQKYTLYGNKQGHLTSKNQASITAHYGYDYLNKRKYKVVDTLGNSNARKQVLYIDDDTELRDGKLYKYIRFGGQRIARTDQTGGTFTPTEWYLNNHLGSVQLTLDHNAKVKTASTYEPYGEKRNTWGQTALAPYGFTGKEQDPETGLGYFHNRYLNHASGQFITPDPVFALEERFIDPQHWSPYAYGRNNPIVYTDPNGRNAIRFGAQFAKEPVRTTKAGARIVRSLLQGSSLESSSNYYAEEGGEAYGNPDAPDVRTSGEKVDDLIANSPDQSKDDEKKRRKAKKGTRAISERDLDLTDMDDAKDIANSTFDDLGMDPATEEPVDTEFGKGRKNKDSNDRTIIVRPSADGRPTIEVQPVKGSGKIPEEIRFGSRDLQGYNR